MLRFFLFGILAGLIIAASPYLGSLATQKYFQRSAVSEENSSIQPLAEIKPEKENNQLPLTADIFLFTEHLPIGLVRNWNISEPQIAARSAIIFDTGYQEILWQKNDIHHRQPIASLTKLMTALVVLENSQLDDVYTVSKKAVDAFGENGGLVVGEKLTVKSLLYALLIESSNDAAEVLAENIQQKTNQDIMVLMNQKAQQLGLKNTTFADASGLSPQNQSSAWDLTQIMKAVLNQLILKEITQSAAADIASVDGVFKHHLTSTNKLLANYPEIIAGKTGYTEEAGGCLVLAIKSPANDNNASIIVVMGSPDRLAETATLIKWTKEAYLW